jgi:hypothetical protein
MRCKLKFILPLLLLDLEELSRKNTKKSIQTSSLSYEKNKNKNKNKTPSHVGPINDQ